jgi:serine/threonine protein kinase
MEFMNNGDLLTYNKGNNRFHALIPEGKLWDIFYKCLSGLNHIHEKGIIHRDIKLNNIFLDDNFNVRIGDFNCSVVINEDFAKKFSENIEEIDNLINKQTGVGNDDYKSPEMKDRNRNYDQKTDIYSMGVIFFILCLGCKPTECRNNNENSKHYSKDIKNFIVEMLKYNPDERPTSQKAMHTAKEYFIKTYLKNTSLEAAFNCFNNFPNFIQFFSNNENANNILETNKEITKLCLGIILSIKNKDDMQIKNDLYDLRKILMKEGLDIKSDNMEIDPIKFILYFIEKLNTDLNEVPLKSYINELDNEELFNDKKEVKILKILSKTYQFPPGKEKEIFNLKIYCYNRKILSFISRNFFSYILTQRICKNCRTCRKYFSKMHMIPINVGILEKIMANNNYEISLKNGLNYFVKKSINIKTDKHLVCKICKKTSEFEESKYFYHSAKNFIIVFDRGENCTNHTFVNFDEKITLNNSLGTIDRVDYKLLGIIEKKNEEYISFIKRNNIWLSLKGEEFNFDEAKKYGIVVALFYYSENNISIENKNNIDLSSIILDDKIFIKENFYKNTDNNNNLNNNNNIPMLIEQNPNFNNNIIINNNVEQSYTDNQLSSFLHGNFNGYNPNMGNQQGVQIMGSQQRGQNMGIQQGIYNMGNQQGINNMGNHQGIQNMGNQQGIHNMGNHQGIQNMGNQQGINNMGNQQGGQNMGSQQRGQMNFLPNVGWV